MGSQLHPVLRGEHNTCRISLHICSAYWTHPKAIHADLFSISIYEHDPL